MVAAGVAGMPLLPHRPDCEEQINDIGRYLFIDLFTSPGRVMGSQDPADSGPRPPITTPFAFGLVFQESGGFLERSLQTHSL